MQNMGKRNWRYFVIRLLAIAIGLSPFLFFEIGLHLTGWNETDEILDPYVGFSAVRPLFVPSDDSQEYKISETRYPLFQPESFPAKKSDNGFRIFCLGGSTVQGRPYSIETSFSRWLEINLGAANPEHDWEVVNCGGVSYASYRLVPILQEVLTYQPDLIILYTGHNEFLEDRTYDSIKQTPALVKAAHERLSYLKSYRFLRSLFVDRDAAAQASGSRSTLPVDVEAELDFQGGLGFYRRDEAWRSDVISHFEFNLQQMAKLARSTGVPLMLVNPVSNLSGTVPFKSEHGAQVSVEVRQQFDALRNRGASSFQSVEQEAGRLKELLALDPDYAALHFRLGQCQLAQNQLEAARQSFVRAKELDVCPLRILEPMHEIILRTSANLDLPLVDVKAIFEQASEQGIAGDALLIDHVHPTIRSHQLIAERLADKMQALGWLEITRPDWMEQRQQAYVGQLESLDFMYFQRGKDRLRGLQRWARGEAQAERPEQ